MKSAFEVHTEPPLGNLCRWRGISAVGVPDPPAVVQAGGGPGFDAFHAQGQAGVAGVVGEGLGGGAVRIAEHGQAAGLEGRGDPAGDRLAVALLVEQIGSEYQVVGGLGQRNAEVDPFGAGKRNAITLGVEAGVGLGNLPVLDQAG